MQGVEICFYVQEDEKHQHHLLYEWLLKTAQSLGVHGGTATRALAGFGRHGVRHEAHFVELQGDLPVVVKFVLDLTQASALLDALRQENLSLFYTQTEVSYGLSLGTL